MQTQTLVTLAIATVAWISPTMAQDQSFFDVGGVLFDCGGSTYLQPSTGSSPIGIPDAMGFPLGSCVHLIGLGGSTFDPLCAIGHEHVTDYVLSATSPVTYYCACDLAAPCPAALSTPDTGCVNGTGSGAFLTLEGIPRITTLVPIAVQGWGLNPGQLAVPFMGSGQVVLPFGNGKLCVGGPGSTQYRFPAQVSSLGAGQTYAEVVQTSQTFPLAGRVQAGSTWNFQIWYRDPAGTCGSSFNTTNAAQVTFFP